jgi:hypothetical protein
MLVQSHANPYSGLHPVPVNPLQSRDGYWANSNLCLLPTDSGGTVPTCGASQTFPLALATGEVAGRVTIFQVSTSWLMVTYQVRFWTGSDSTTTLCLGTCTQERLNIFHGNRFCSSSAQLAKVFSSQQRREPNSRFTSPHDSSFIVGSSQGQPYLALHPDYAQVHAYHDGFGFGWASLPMSSHSQAAAPTLAGALSLCPTVWNIHGSHCTLLSWARSCPWEWCESLQ